MNNTKKSRKSERSSQQDWVAAALELLGQQGLKAVTIAALCKKLKLTTGSFYWHFSGRQQLLSAMAESWANTQGKEVLQQLRLSGLSDREQLAEINRLSTQAGYGNIDHAMRIWAEDCQETAAAVQAADQQLLGFVAEKLCNLGLSDQDARALAHVALACGVGFFAIAPSLETDSFNDIASILDRTMEYLKT